MPSPERWRINGRSRLDNHVDKDQLRDWRETRLLPDLQLLYKLPSTSEAMYRTL